MKKWSMILGAVVLAGGILGACSESETKEQTTDKPEKETAEQSGQDTEVQQGNEGTTQEPADKETTQAPETNKETTPSTEKKPDSNTQQPAAVTETKGTFNGVADPHTVEIEVNGQPQSFQVAPDSDMMKKFDQMEEGTEVTFTYKKEGEQLILQELKAQAPAKTNSDTAAAIETHGTFNGVADPHTVEIEVDGQPQAFQVDPNSDMMKKFDQMEEGTEFSFTYKKEGEQLIIQELK
ncbi:hypothetical protein [Pseudobacillus wudalianchiensis]|uniref:Lipoprotein n=1 Tax=Pseudobacillus wudalianchiensis TaxID=1743143 RepID=A0A1B9AMB2_9BACI|nr:hypothetical protein [Bacillus wudalianchiensis]OCA85054.1 hypothetical protein A8F95_10200 [Bacillus wudalianchiensis]